MYRRGSCVPAIKLQYSQANRELGYIVHGPSHAKAIIQGKNIMLGGAAWQLCRFNLAMGILSLEVLTDGDINSFLDSIHAPCH